MRSRLFRKTEYDPAGRVIAEIDANGNRTEYEYDAADRRIVSRDANGHETHYGYDANGNLTSQTDANGYTITFEYDALDNRIRTVYPDTTESSQSYDPMGRVTDKTDPNGYTTTYVYDGTGQLIEVRDAELGIDQGITRYDYDEVGNKLSQTDAAGRITRWTYDALGRERSRQLPLGQIDYTRYNSVGDRDSHTDFMGQVTAYQYDSNHRVTRIDYSDLSFETIGYTYEGQRSSATTRAGASQRWDYDNRGRLAWAVNANGDRIDYGYDNVGNRTAVTVTPAGGTADTTGYGYDGLNRLATVTDSSSQVTTYSYDNAGNRASVTYPNGNVTSYSYDSLNRLTRQTTADSLATVLTDYQYTLDDSGHRTQISEASGRVTDYTYDRLYRLETETVSDAVNGNYSASYSYDKVGNRTYSTIDGVQTAYSYDDNDRLTQQGGTSYTYDDNGNTLTETLDGHTDTYSYNVRNELIGSTKGSVTASYAYDIDGIRMQKIEDGTSTDYLVDHNRDYAQVLRETSGTDTVDYLYGDDLIRQSRAGADSYYLYDGLGSTRALSDSTGSVTDTYNYAAFGDILNQSGSTANEYRFTGEQYDSSLDNYYLRARYYDPDRGGFTQMDTWMGNNQDPVTLHKYLYANANPVDNVDPAGNFSIGSVMSAVNVVATLATRADAAYNLYSLATGDQELTARQIGFEILAGMGAGKLIKMFSKKFKTCKIANSFVEGTLVYTPNGLIPIEEIKIGDLVYSYDENAEGIVEQKVVHLIEGEKEREIITLGTRSGDIVQATDGHPFYVSENDEKWIKAGNLSIGNILLNSDGRSVPIVDIVSKISFEKVYNLSVENSHSYYVGQQKLLVHNSGCRIPHRGKPRIEQGNDREGWIHIQKRHILGGGAPGTQGDLFAPGTTLAHIEQAAARLVAKGKRLSDPNSRIQRFEKKMTVNGKTANYRVIVDSDDGNRVITMFPVGGG